MGIEDDLKSAFPSGPARPDWNDVERRVAGIRRRRQRTRVVAAVGVLALIVGLGALLRTDGPSSVDTDEVADSDAAPIAPATPVDQPVDCPEGPAGDPTPPAQIEAEIAELLQQVDETGLTPIFFAPDCGIGFVETDEFVVVGVPHADLIVLDEDGEHVGWLVYGLPAMTIEEYELDPEGHRLRGLERVQELEEGLGGSTPEGE